MQGVIKILDLWRRLMLGEYGARTELLKLQNHEELANEQVKIAERAIKKFSLSGNDKI